MLRTLMEMRVGSEDIIGTEIGTTSTGEEMMGKMILKGEGGTRTKTMSEGTNGAMTMILIETAITKIGAVGRTAERENPLGTAVRDAVVIDPTWR